MEGFKKFILRGNVVDLAVGVVVGAAFNSVVSSLVKNFFTPIVAIVLGNQNFASLYFTVNNVKVNYGDFINAFISFLIIAFVVAKRTITFLLHFDSKTLPDARF